MSTRRVIGALVYLRANSLRNAAIARLARLKQPRYLVGAIVGAAYFAFVFGRGPFNRAGRTPEAAAAFPLERMPTVLAVAALLVTLWVALYWLWPRSRAGLRFSEAEIAFLFPAPVSRRTLIHFRWINAQLKILFTSLILTLVSASWSFVPGNAAVRLLGYWLLLSTIDLHGIGSSFAITRLLDRGMTSLRRSALILGVTGAAVAVALIGSWRALRAPEPGTLADPSAVLDYVGSLLMTEPLAWLLTPARWAVQPLFADDLTSFAAALGPALLLYAAHYLWVLRSEVSFEEASLAQAEKRAARVRAMRRTGTVRLGSGERKAQPAPFKLADVGRPEIAFLWKNLLASASYLQRPRAALIAAALIVVGSGWLARLDVPPLPMVLSMFGLVGAGYTLAFGPMLARQDLRHDLPNTDILKTYPLPGWQVVLGEILAPIAIITVLVWLQLLVAALNLRPPDGTVPLAIRAAVAVGAGLMVPFLSATLVVLMNAFTLLFPAWAPQPGRARGIDAMGQGILFLGVMILAMVSVLLPAALAAAAVFFLLLWVTGPIVASVFGVLAALVVLGTEIAFAISLLGKRFERFDLSVELK